MSTTERVSPIDYNERQLQELEAEKAYMAEYVENRKPYWMNLRHPRGEELQWELNNYAPLAHYDIAIERVADRIDTEFRPDGGWTGYDETPENGSNTYDDHPR